MRISDWSSDVCSSDLLVDGEGSDAGSAGRRVRCIGVAMVEIDPRLGRGLGDGLVDILAYRHGPHRNRTVGKRLCHGDYVRLHAEALRAEIRAEPPEAANHLVEDEENAIGVADLPQPLDRKSTRLNSSH